MGWSVCRRKGALELFETFARFPCANDHEERTADFGIGSVETDTGVAAGIGSVEIDTAVAKGIVDEVAMDSVGSTETVAVDVLGRGC